MIISIKVIIYYRPVFIQISAHEHPQSVAIDLFVYGGMISFILVGLPFTVIRKQISCKNMSFAQSGSLNFVKMHVEQLRQEANLERIPVSEAVNQ